MSGIFDKDNKKVSNFLKATAKAAKKDEEKDDGSVLSNFSKIMSKLTRKDPGEVKKSKKQKQIEKNAERKGSLGDVINQFGRDMRK